MVGEEGCDGPGGAEDGDYEEDEDVIGGEGIGFRVDVDEVGEHAERGDLWMLAVVGGGGGVEESRNGSLPE